uniref:Regucalcin n=1 Tax=Oryzias sinensis TaxID=183150 RepID=A0A8C7WZB0_9TELE
RTNNNRTNNSLVFDSETIILFARPHLKIRFFFLICLALISTFFLHTKKRRLCVCLANRRVVYRMKEGEGLPDGMTTDVDGRLWVACYNGGRVIHIDPTTGVQLQTVSLPVTKVTSCCFGGPDFSDLFVTSASLGLDQSEKSQQPLAGNTFRVRGLGVKGQPSRSFIG